MIKRFVFIVVMVAGLLLPNITSAVADFSLGYGEDFDINFDAPDSYSTYTVTISGAGTYPGDNQPTNILIEFEIEMGIGTCHVNDYSDGGSQHYAWGSVYSLGIYNLPPGSYWLYCDVGWNPWTGQYSSVHNGDFHVVN